jgi:hypothetical protein
MMYCGLTNSNYILGIMKPFLSLQKTEVSKSHNHNDMSKVPIPVRRQPFTACLRLQYGFLNHLSTALLKGFLNPSEKILEISC